MNANPERTTPGLPIGINAYYPVDGTDLSGMDFVVDNGVATDAELDAVCDALRASGLFGGSIRRRGYMFTVHAGTGEVWTDMLSERRPDFATHRNPLRWEAVALLALDTLGWEGGVIAAWRRM